jgi:hypothetical protein
MSVFAVLNIEAKFVRAWHKVQNCVKCGGNETTCTLVLSVIMAEKQWIVIKVEQMVIILRSLTILSVCRPTLFKKLK